MFTLASGSAILNQPVVNGGAVFAQKPLKSPFFELCGRRGRIQNAAGTALQVNLLLDGGTAVELTEAQEISTFTNPIVNNAEFPAFYIGVPVAVSDHVIDNASKAAYYVDPVANQSVWATPELIKKVESELLGSTTDRGLFHMVSSTTTCGGLSVATAPDWASTQTAVNAELGNNHLEDGYSTLSENSDIAPDVIIAPSTQYKEIQRFGSTTAGPSSPARFILNQGDQTMIDVGVANRNLFWSGIEVVNVFDMADSDKIIMGTMEHYSLFVQSDISFKPLGKTGNYEKAYLQMGVIPAITRRNAFAVLTGLGT